MSIRKTNENVNITTQNILRTKTTKENPTIQTTIISFKRFREIEKQIVDQKTRTRTKNQRHHFLSTNDDAVHFSHSLSLFLFLIKISINSDLFVQQISNLETSKTKFHCIVSPISVDSSFNLAFFLLLLFLSLSFFTSQSS